MSSWKLLQCSPRLECAAYRKKKAYKLFSVLPNSIQWRIIYIDNTTSILENHNKVWDNKDHSPIPKMHFAICAGNVNVWIYLWHLSNPWCRDAAAPVPLICMSACKASVNRWLLKPPRHIWATCHPGIGRDPFKKAHPKHALHYHNYQLPDVLYISLRILQLKAHTNAKRASAVLSHYDIWVGASTW